MQLSHTVPTLCPRPLKILNATTRFSYNLKNHILSKVLCGQSLVNPFYAYLNNLLTFHSISELCDFLLCSKNKGNAYLSKNIKIIGLLYSSKFNMCTSLIETLHFLFVIVVLLLFLRMMPLFVLQIMEDFALPKVNICTSRCEYMYFLLSYFCTSR
jgi:hypothetical protein